MCTIMAKKRNFRSTPNVLITGTPGTGKTTFARMLATATGFRNVNVGDWVKEQVLHSGWDEAHQCYTLDEDKVSALPLSIVSAERRLRSRGLLHACNGQPVGPSGITLIHDTSCS